MTAVIQPSGTVTMVFTDIEGSTRLLEELGVDAYREALAEHRRVVRAACARHQGYEVEHEGDAFFYTFASAQAAVAAVSEAMVGLEPGPIRIRVGVHTGEPGLDPPKYVGLDVHRAARIMSSAHGGQIVLSRDTAKRLPDDEYLLVDLGDHRLKDLGQPERIYQIGKGEHPALKSLYRITLPVPGTPFLGRDQELTTVVELLTDNDTRLLTLTGPGGTGKTRLALQAAAEASPAFPDGVTWLSLAPLTDASLVLPALARVLGGPEDLDKPLADTLHTLLDGEQRLLVIDNAEHLLPAIAGDIAFLADISGPTLLVTTRERLALRAERIYAVPSLSLPDAIVLFNERARSIAHDHDLDHAAIPTLCERLDRLPLAIELAAARTALFDVGELVERIGQHLDLLRGGRDLGARHQTLRATIDWSYRLLDDDEQHALQALSVFAGGCTLSAAEATSGADPDVLQSLVDKSLLLHRDGVNGRRYWQLQTIRDYGLEQLELAGATRVAVSTAARFLAGVVRELWTEAENAGSSTWKERFADEQANVQALARQAVACSAYEDALRLASDSANLWRQVGELREGYDLVTVTLDKAGETPPSLRIEALNRASTLAYNAGDYDTAVSLAESALTLLDTSDDPNERLLAMGNIAAFALDAGNHALAERHLSASLKLAQDLGDETEIARASYNLGLVAQRQGDPVRAHTLITTAHEVVERLGNVPGQLFCLGLLGRVHRESGELVQAAAALRRALALVTQTGHDLLAAGQLEELAEVARQLGEFEVGARFMRTALDLREQHGSNAPPEEQAVIDETRAALEQASVSAASILDESRPLHLDECIELAQQLVIDFSPKEAVPRMLGS